MYDIVSIKEKIKERFSFFGVNKQQELVRLVFEIMQKKNCHIDDVLLKVSLKEKKFSNIKAILIKERFPLLTQQGIHIDESFSQLDIRPEHQVDFEDINKPFYPKNIYIEKNVSSSDLAKRVMKKFPLAIVERIESYKTKAQQKPLDIIGYNRRRQDLFLIEEQHDFYKKCPCSCGVVGCGYHNINLGIGCPFDCSYCFLQSYTNALGIVLPANIERFLKEFETYPQHIRLGSGELTDSLVFDDITYFSSILVDFFRDYPQSVFEFKTKSVVIEPLLSLKASSNIVVSWSVNPQTLIEQQEHGTASLQQRLDAAKRCVAHGYKVGFHFDPMVMFEGWRESYSQVIHQIFKEVPKEAIAWISLGMLRMTQKQKKIIENRFQYNNLLQEELLIADDGKLRYHSDVRIEAYQWMYEEMIGQTSKDTYIYLCMEIKEVWDSWQRKIKK